MIYVSTTFAKDNSKVKNPIDKLLKINVKNIELGSNHCFEKDISYVKKYKLNYLVHNYFPVPKKQFVINIASLDKKIRKKSVNHIFKSINFSKSIKAKLYTFHPGFLTDPRGKNKNNINYDFQWDNKKLLKKNYHKSWKIMISSLKKIVIYAKKKNVKIAIETEGSMNSPEHLLMQKPNEFLKLMKIFHNNEIGFNLNIGHLNLASKYFKFDKLKLVNLVSPYVVALELSHNYGKNDDHLPLKKKAWYWKIINLKKFKNIPKILEFRNAKIKDIKRVTKYFN